MSSLALYERHWSYAMGNVEVTQRNRKECCIVALDLLLPCLYIELNFNIFLYEHRQEVIDGRIHNNIYVILFLFNYSLFIKFCFFASIA